MFLSGNTIITRRDLHSRTARPAPTLHTPAPATFGVESILVDRGQSVHTNSIETSQTQGEPWFGPQPQRSWVGYCFMDLVALGKWNPSGNREGKKKLLGMLCLHLLFWVYFEKDLFLFGTFHFLLTFWYMYLHGRRILFLSSAHVKWGFISLWESVKYSGRSLSSG